MIFVCIFCIFLCQYTVQSITLVLAFRIQPRVPRRGLIRPNQPQTPRTLRSAIGTEVTVSLNLTRSKKKAPEEAGTLDLALFVERSGPVSEATAKADALPPDPALLVERGGWEPGDDEAAKEDTNPDAWLQVRRRAFRAILNRQ